METKIDIISRELIKPSSPTPDESKEHKLSLLDQNTPQLYMRLLFFYQNQSPNYSSNIAVDPRKTVILHLKQSLSECLTRFYPLAGKLIEDHNYIDCDDSGALFVEAKVDAPLSEAVQNAPYEHFGQYLPFEDQSADGGEGKTLLAIQVSWFKCGGNVIGISMSHTLGDLTSLITFMNSWTAINRGEGAKLLVVPNFDAGRNLFPPRNSPYRFPISEVKGKIVCKRFLFSKEKLLDLKETAKSFSSSIAVKDPTRIEVVTAFLLKQFINVERAKNKNNIHNSCSRFRVWHAVNLRSRFSSLAALSSKANEFPFGNLSTVATDTFTIPDDNDDESGQPDYGDLVSFTRNAIRKLNEDYFLNFVVPYLDRLVRSRTTGTEEEAEAEEQDSVARIKRIHFTSWCGFPWYEMDFGWGKPVSVGPAGDRHSLSTRVILKNSESSRDAGIEAWVYMWEDEVALLPGELLSLAATDYFRVLSFPPIPFRELIKPSSKTPDESKEHKLSLLDQHTPQLHIRLLFFYQNQSPGCSSNVPSKTVTLRLKRSLSECLTRFYLLAGKLIEDHNYINCDDSGALFVEAKVDASLSEAVQNAPYEHFGQYFPFEDQSADDGEGRTLLAIQVSLFKCGGIVIGISMSHVLGDLMFLVTFMNSWAAINRRENIESLLVPNFDIGRNVFPPRNSPYRFPVSEVKGKIVCKRFLFSKEKLTELKKLANSSSSSSPIVKDPSRLEVVTAFLLKQFISVERAKKRNNPTSSCSRFSVWHAVNLRSRFSSLALLSSKANEFPFRNLSAMATDRFTIRDNNDDESCYEAELQKQRRKKLSKN
ncbi:OLC1v1031716C1 [Oldenlandia corymbosa var. corymbosa]|uniref:OLC1v1031716C1 n=1 Tax=Oldenlandia corymbosa var. corymbosa TaxID=529605 RepID=A0AAV1CK09_OLDCO|nr:OLC1v1031716C1 [Oldenlandia corymbosa var. corymbosa]